ncbi:MAG: cytochrome c family protein [Paracoccaceae bacterium]
MFDTMTVTKVSAGLCGALLVFLLGKTTADALYTSHGHGEQSYVIDTGADDSGASEEAGPSLEEMLASADVEKGAKVFKKCSACHKLEDGANSTGPYLYGVVGRDKGSASGFSGYSSTLASMEGDWSPENLDGFLTKPKDYAPGTTMAFAGLKKPQDRANLIAYLDSLDN